MKITLQILGLLLVMYSCKSTKKVISPDTNGKIKQELIGTWQFEILRDKQGLKLDTIWHGRGYEIPNGPLMTFKKDGTYSKQYTPENIDTGKWYFNEKEYAIKLLLYYDKPYDSGIQYLIDKDHAKKDKNGEYYEVITMKVFKLTVSKLTVIEREERRRTFRKSN